MSQCWCRNLDDNGDNAFNGAVGTADDVPPVSGAGDDVLSGSVACREWVTIICQVRNDSTLEARYYFDVETADNLLGKGNDSAIQKLVILQKNRR